MGRELLQIILVEDFSALNGQKEPPWGSNGSDSATELALVPVRLGYASPIVERMVFQLQEEGEEGEMKVGALAVLQSLVDASVCQHKGLKRKFCTY